MLPPSCPRRGVSHIGCSLHARAHGRRHGDRCVAVVLHTLSFSVCFLGEYRPPAAMLCSRRQRRSAEERVVGLFGSAPARQFAAFFSHPSSHSAALARCRALCGVDRLRQEGKTNLSHDGLNPAHVPCWWVNNPTLPLGCGWEARKSRHRRIKKRRRFERLAATSQLSLW